MPPKGKTSGQSKQQQQEHNPQELLDRARKALDTCQPDLAREFCLRALKASESSTAPEQAVILEFLGIVEMEAAAAAAAVDGADDGDQKAQEATARAEEYFRKAVEIDPTAVGASCYMYLGQMAVEKESIDFYERGIAIMMNDVEEGRVSEEEIPQMQQKVMSAFCSMTEIYMTDLCDEPEAESKCEEFMSRALQIDTQYPEVNQTLASVRLSQSRPQEARALMETSLKGWIDENPAECPNWPIYHQRINAAKILLELGMYEAATRVLQTCLQENDSDPEGWYLFGWCYFRMGGGEAGQEAQELAASVGGEQRKNISLEEKVAFWVDARECLSKLIEISEAIEVEGPMMEHAKDLVQTIEPFLQQHSQLAQNVAQEGDVVEEDDDEMEM
ncbi:hypothetical protein HDU76_002292 [Blyttiomyces sp. JEL0837]|nr:hypothetical protein HDU76_002292 [Blyttiomyces sp. JEL0837]